MSVVAENRMVVEYSEGKSTSHWVPPRNRVKMIGDDTFVALGYSGDRGFAKFVGGDMAASNPLVGFAWLEQALKRRNLAVNEELDKLALEKVPGHQLGKPIPKASRMSLANELPQTLELTFPPLADTHGSCVLTVVTETEPTRHLAVKCTTEAMVYVRAAMAASKTDDTHRARPKHSERLAEQTGMKGVHKRGSRVGVEWVDSDGKKCMKTAKVPLEASADNDELALTCKRLKSHAARAADEPSPAKAPVQSVHGESDEDVGESDVGESDDSADDGEDDHDEPQQPAAEPPAPQTSAASSSAPADAEEGDGKVPSSAHQSLQDKWGHIFGHLKKA